MTCPLVFSRFLRFRSPMARLFFTIALLSEYVFPRFLNSDRAFCLALGTCCVVTCLVGLGRVASRRVLSRCAAARPVLPVLSCPVLSCPVRSGPVRSGPVRSDPVRSGPVRSGPIGFKGLRSVWRRYWALFSPQKKGRIWVIGR